MLKPQLFWLIAAVAAIIATASAGDVEYKMTTKFSRLGYRLRWRAEDLSLLTPEYNSLPFITPEGIFNGSVGLNVDTVKNIMTINLIPHTFMKQFFLEGNVDYYNSTTYLTDDKIKKMLITDSSEVMLVKVDLQRVFGKTSLEEIFKMLDDIWVLDFYFGVLAPNTTIVNNEPIKTWSFFY